MLTIESLVETLEMIQDADKFQTVLECHYTSSPWSEKVEGTTRFILVRHGESTANLERIYAGQAHDIDLTDKGVEQATEAGKRLAWVSVDGILSSPSLRAKKTADLILRERVLKPDFYEIDDRLMEKHHGKFDGMPVDEALAEMKPIFEANDKLSFKERFAFKFDPNHPLEESLETVYNRAISALAERHADSNTRGKTYLVATHGGVMKTLFMADLVQNHSLDLSYHRFEINNCAILVLDFSDESAQITAAEKLNFRAPLPH